MSFNGFSDQSWPSISISWSPTATTTGIIACIIVPRRHFSFWRSAHIYRAPLFLLAWRMPSGRAPSQDQVPLALGPILSVSVECGQRRVRHGGCEFKINRRWSGRRRHRRRADRWPTTEYSDEEGRKVEPVRTYIYLSRRTSLAYRSACLSYYRYPSTWCTPRARVNIDAIFQNVNHDPFIHQPSLSLVGRG